jgi:hypothetical protein
MATDPTNHAAMMLTAWDNDVYAPPVIATYTADANGNLTTTSTFKNMATLEEGPYNECLNYTCGYLRMSPSGKLLAAVVPGGLQLFHFNGGDPATKYKTLVANNIGSILWDNDNHMYALGSDSKGDGKLWVYTVTPTSVTEAPGSPYAVTNAGSMVVQALK